MRLEFGAVSRCRPRILTVGVLIAVAAPIALANLSSGDMVTSGLTMDDVEYGWPVTWYWRNLIVKSPAPPDWRVLRYSWPRLAGNLAIWAVVLATSGAVCEWLMRRCRPRLRWNLQTMFVWVALVAVLFAWCASTRRLADEQDAVLVLIGGDSHVYFDRWGPKWLDLVGADRFRRRIICARVDQQDMNDEIFERLARLPSLYLLDINPFHYEEPFVFTCGMGAALGDMRQLRILNVECTGNNQDELRTVTHECLAAVGRLTQLERLRVAVCEECSDELANLADLTKLKSLAIDICPFADLGDEDSEEVEADRDPNALVHFDRADRDLEDSEDNDEPRTLAHLPVLTRLEALELHEWELGDQYLGRLARCQRLKSIDLSHTTVSSAGLAKLAPLDSLEELAIHEDTVTAAAFEAMLALSQLRIVHICGPRGNQTDAAKLEKSRRRAAILTGDPANAETMRPATLTLDDGHDLVVLSNEIGGLRRALETLRRSHPGIVIAADCALFQKQRDLRPPWHTPNRDRALRSFIQHWFNQP